VDVASGVESSPGVKDPVKLREFIGAAHAAARSVVVTEGGVAASTYSRTGVGDAGPADGAPGLFDWQDEE
jgi:hypothetical protein